MPRLWSLLLALALVSPPTRAAEQAPARAEPLVIFAAASLVDVLPRVAQAWSGGQVTFSFEASSRLATQLAQGAPADLFFSADREWMAYAVDRKLVAQPVDLLGNTLVAVVPARASFVPGDANALRNKTIQHIALASENVPAGRYAREALRKLGVWDAVQERVVNGTNVRQALEYAARGEAEVAIVYRTDAQGDARVRQAFAFDPATHAPIVYPLAVVRRSSQAARAEAFLQFCRGPQARALFEQAGFRVLGGS